MNKYLLAGLLALPALGMCHQNADAFFCFQGYRCGTYSVNCPRFHFNMGFDSGKAGSPGMPATCHPGFPGCPSGAAGPGGGPGGYGSPWYMHFPHGGQHGFVPQYPNYAAQPQQPGQLPNPTPVQQPTAPAVNPNGTQPTSFNPYAGYNPGYYQYYQSYGYNVPSYWHGR